MSDLQPTTDHRYGTFETADGTLVIYDVDNHRSWIQSDQTVALDAQA
jgi:hypothetical protein